VPKTRSARESLGFKDGKTLIRLEKPDQIQQGGVLIASLQ
jgi:hypothetical protein